MKEIFKCYRRNEIAYKYIFFHVSASIYLWDSFIQAFKYFNSLKISDVILSSFLGKSFIISWYNISCLSGFLAKWYKKNPTEWEVWKTKLRLNYFKIRKYIIYCPLKVKLFLLLRIINYTAENENFKNSKTLRINEWCFALALYM